MSLSLQQLKNDLNWLCQSPVLLAHDAHPTLLRQPLPPHSNIDIQILLDDADALEESLTHRRQHLLGIYYETLWQYIFLHTPQLEVVDSNRQVNDNRKTVGEFDLLYRTQGSNHHREMAIKLYLGLPGTSTDASNWVGPGLIDRLDLKLERLLTHQITLALTDAGRTSLKEIDFDSPRPEILLQGYLFYPWNRECPPPAIASANHNRGDWLPLSQLDEYLDDIRAVSGYSTLPTRQWLSPVNTSETEDEAFVNRDQLQKLICKYFKINNRPVLVAACSHNGTSYKEQQRFFIVPNNWEELASESAR